MSYNPQAIEKKWQKIWERSNIYKTPDRVPGKKNFYHLVMFPYPSGDLHIGHWYNFAPADVYARFKRMQGFNVLSPIGFDAFGLPAENAAIKHHLHPKTWTNNNIKRMRKQLKSIGACYDWDREIITSEPDYYRWTQWMFLQLFKAGLAYRKRVPGNWCPSCQTVLANEQVIDGKCERCDSVVFQKEIEQWLLRITSFADSLARDLEKLDWPERTKIIQRNWIGRTEGMNITYPIKGLNKKIVVFTTRPETNFGATFIALAPDSKFVKENSKFFPNKKEVEKYIEKTKTKTELERLSEGHKKTGVFTGLYAINNLNKREMPIYLSDFVLATVGTGAVVGVPGHDLRDFEFAQQMGLDIVRVVVGPDGDKGPITKKEQVQEGQGIMVNSRFLDGLDTTQANQKIKSYIEEKGWGERAVNYRLRDWVISRQRYWGAPIPIVYCRKCWEKLKTKSQKSKIKEGVDYVLIDNKEHRIVPVPEKELPVLLPSLKDFRPTNKGGSPLARSKKFIKTKCPICQAPAQRETDTMDTFVCSSWYFLRYTDPKNKNCFASKAKIKAWLPVDVYVGGVEHTVMHLLYARFLTKALKALGYLDFSEPFLRLQHQGVILGPDGQKMSKSRGNVVDPDAQVLKYGSDAVRMYLCFMGPYEQGGPWNPRGIVGISRFLNKIFNFQFQISKQIPRPNNQNSKLKKLLHKTIKKVTEDIEKFRFNTALSALMVLVGQMQKSLAYNLEELKTLLLLLAPFAPHLTEELWQRIKKQKSKKTKKELENKINPSDSIHNQSWPKYNPALIKEEKTLLIIQINGKIRDKTEIKTQISKQKAQRIALAREKVQKYIRGKKIKKIIFVPDKLINFVI